MNEGEKMFVLNCCRRGVHKVCLDDRFPDWRKGLARCPKGRRRTGVTIQVIQRDEFSPEDSDKIEMAFFKHHTVTSVPMTAEEITGLRVALNVRGYRGMGHVSHRVFAVALFFWMPLPKKRLCDWEDIVARLSLGLIWNMMSEMRDRYQKLVERDGSGCGRQRGVQA